jgi:hypothetical protein
MIIPAEVYREAHDRIYGPYGAEIEWKDRDGHVWKVTEMADDHLENSMNYMLDPDRARAIHDRECYRMAEAGDDPIIGPHGDAANDAFDAEFNHLMDMDPVEYIKTMYPPYLAMKAVLEHREQLMQQRIKDMTHADDPEWVEEATHVTPGEAALAFAKKAAEVVDGHYCSDCGGQDALEHDLAVAFQMWEDEHNV